MIINEETKINLWQTYSDVLGNQEIELLTRSSFDKIIEEINRLEKPVMPKIAEKKQNIHNMDIIHLGCCTKCGDTNFTNHDCTW